MKPSKTVFNAYFGEEVKYITDADYAKIDEMFRKYHCNPETFCRFVMSTRVPEYIYPRWIFSEAVQREFADWIKEQETTIPISGGLELESFYAHMNFEADPIKVILDKNLPLSPLLRYLVAMFLHREDIASKYRYAASQQLIEYPWYAKVFYKFADFFPKEVPYA